MCGLIGELKKSSIHGPIKQFEGTHITGNASTKHGQHQQATYSKSHHGKLIKVLCRLLSYILMNWERKTHSFYIIDMLICPRRLQKIQPHTRLYGNPHWLSPMLPKTRQCRHICNNDFCIPSWRGIRDTMRWKQDFLRKQLPPSVCFNSYPLVMLLNMAIVFPDFSIENGDQQEVGRIHFFWDV